MYLIFEYSLTVLIGLHVLPLVAELPQEGF
jgi:hypothetical protein